MRDRVVLKWGGGLITEKDRLKTVRTDVLDQLAEQLHSCLKEGVDVILVHGAGSYGHLKAKKYQLAEGFLSGVEFEPLTQHEAVTDVRNDMLELNQHVMESLTRRDISAVALPPHQWARGTGPQFQGDLSFFEQAPKGIVMVTFGDVVDCDGDKEFGILSGDDIVKRLAAEIKGIKRLVFAMGGVEGVLASPPSEDNPTPELLSRLTKDDVFVGEHQSNMDVTGGIGLKVRRGFETLEAGVEVWLVSGEVGIRVQEACMGLPVVGTQLLES
ncbi:MAG: isopentenyl phosphate kinase family protein [Candidatus Poseidonia sp.]|nr:isopentenyl phosphate kinase family protein [Poseidonia sp.]MBL6805998.1 isopentenyl phosphate kinase family protein [Poseidonia sp.]MBL6886637.1 isopentenyl phosphate kinase family protein [Poseidonia sp.]MBL6892078.1 isopentenyl phosphate kinase family protein [Poseidonia sp.]